MFIKYERKYISFYNLMPDRVFSLWKLCKDCLQIIRHIRYLERCSKSALHVQNTLCIDGVQCVIVACCQLDLYKNTIYLDVCSQLVWEYTCDRCQLHTDCQLVKQYTCTCTKIINCHLIYSIKGVSAIHCQLVYK